MVFKKAKVFFELVVFEHTIFALPFAYIGAVLSAGGIPGVDKWIWITLAMAGARTAGMSLNRVIDKGIDLRNERTKDRPIQRGAVSLGVVNVYVALSFGLLLFSAGMLNPLCFKLAPVAAVLLFLYSYVKRFSYFSHFVLGAILGIAPVGGWLAINAYLEATPVLLFCAVLFWTAGFDIIYAVMDVDFDRKEGLFSIPSVFGIKAGLIISVFCHVITVALFATVGIINHAGLFYWIGFALSVAVLIYEHCIVTPKDLSRINKAFFTLNGWVSVVFFCGVLLDFIKRIYVI